MLKYRVPVVELWEWVCGVDREWCQHWKNLFFEIVGDPLFLISGEFIVAAEKDLRFFELRHDLLGPAIVLIGDLTLHYGLNAAQLLFRAEAVGASLNGAGLDLLHQSCDTDLKEFIEIRTHECEVFHPF